MKFVNMIAVNIDATTPKDNVIAKPLIGPDPKIYNNKAANKVVIFASNIVDIALEKPLLIAEIKYVDLFISSFIRSNIKTLASTAIPIVKTIPAIPGRVNVAPIIDNKDIIIKRLAIKAMLAMIPTKP